MGGGGGAVVAVAVVDVGVDDVAVVMALRLLLGRKAGSAEDVCCVMSVIVMYVM